MKRFVILSELPDEAPSEYRLIPAGIYDTTQGTFFFDNTGAHVLMGRWNEEHGDSVDGVMDYNHASIRAHDAKDPAKSGEAACWYNLELRPAQEPQQIPTSSDEVLHCDYDLWLTNMRWVDEAKGMVLSRKYRYTSPVVDIDPVVVDSKVLGRIISLHNVALTNMPATKRQKPLVAMSALFEDDDSMEELDKLKVELSALAPRLDESEKRFKDLETILLSQTGASTISEAVALLKASAATATELSALRADVQALRQKNFEIELSAVKGKFADSINPDVEKHIDELVSLASKANEDPVKAVTTYLSALPPIVDRQTLTPPDRKEPEAPAKTVELSKKDRELMAKLQYGTGPEAEAKFIADFGYLMNKGEK